MKYLSIASLAALASTAVAAPGWGGWHGGNNCGNNGCVTQDFANKIVNEFIAVLSHTSSDLGDANTTAQAILAENYQRSPTPSSSSRVSQ